jgi:hypothetical protein
VARHVALVRELAQALQLLALIADLGVVAVLDIAVARELLGERLLFVLEDLQLVLELRVARREQRVLLRHR